MMWNVRSLWPPGERAGVTMGPDTRSEGALTLDSVVGLSLLEPLQPFWALRAKPQVASFLC